MKVSPHPMWTKVPGHRHNARYCLETPPKQVSLKALDGSQHRQEALHMNWPRLIHTVQDPPTPRTEDGLLSVLQTTSSVLCRAFARAAPSAWRAFAPALCMTVLFRPAGFNLNMERLHWVLKLHTHAHAFLSCTHISSFIDLIRICNYTHVLPPYNLSPPLQTECQEERQQVLRVTQTAGQSPHVAGTH